MEENKSGIRYFYKHSSINAKVGITIKGLSDANDALGITMCPVLPEYKAEVDRLCEKYKQLAIPRNTVNIPRVSLENALTLSRGPISSKMQGKRPDCNPVLDIDISYFRKNHLSECSLFMVAQLCNNGRVLEPPFVTPRVKAFNFFEHVVFPINYMDLAPDASIAISVYDMNKPPEKGLIGGTTINLFNSQKCLRQGNYSLYVHKDKKGDAGVYTETAGLIDNPLVMEKNKLYSYIDKHSNKEIKTIPWLDGLAHQTIGKKLEKIDHDANFGALDVCLPVFDYPVVWKEQKYGKKDVFISFSKFESRLVAANDKSSVEKQSTADPLTATPITLVYDPMVMGKKKEDFLSQTNPIADKYYMLSRVVDEAIAKELRPSPDEMQEIEENLAKPDFHKMYDKDTSLIWRYRYFLQSRKDALVKMLLSSKWEAEEKETLALLNSWAPIDLEQAIMMLSSLFPMNSLYEVKTQRSSKATAAIRHKGVAYMRQIKDEELDTILMQLVQAYRYEDHSKSELKELLLERATNSQLIASCLMWFLQVEIENRSNGPMGRQYELFLKELYEHISRPESKVIKRVLESQQELRKKLLDLNVYIKSSKTKAEEKTKQLRELICRGGKRDMSKFEPVPVPVNPRIVVNGAISEKCSVFRSKTYPMRMTFNVQMDTIEHTKDNSPEYQVIFKEGDDLRQDQLILQMIALMDGLLKKVSVDLMFSVYRVVSSGIKDGFSEFVTESTTVSAVNKEISKNPIDEYLHKVASEKKIAYQTLLDTYVKSCAGYSAATYLLGVGDRHLENLMMRKDGRFFHIDFGFILGHDPKPFPPPIRICKEMVLAMGGKESDTYADFCRKCVDAFLYLRKHCKLIVNLFFLMLHAGLSDLDVNTGHNTLMKLYERFMPDKDEQDAERGFLQLIHESVNATFPKLMEALHEWATYWK